MGFSSRFCQDQASGKPLPQAALSTWLRSISPGRVVLSSNHEMGRTAVLCDPTSVCVTFILIGCEALKPSQDHLGCGDSRLRGSLLRSVFVSWVGPSLRQSIRRYRLDDAYRLSRSL